MAQKYPWYGVVSDFFDGIHYGPRSEGDSFATLDEAKELFDSIELDDTRKGVFVYEFHENSCKLVYEKKRELKQPTPETMGRAKHEWKKREFPIMIVV